MAPTIGAEPAVPEETCGEGVEPGADDIREREWGRPKDATRRGPATLGADEPGERGEDTLDRLAAGAPD